MRAGELGDCMYFINAGFVQVPLSPNVFHPSSSLDIHNLLFPPLLALPWMYPGICACAHGTACTPASRDDALNTLKQCANASGLW